MDGRPTTMGDSSGINWDDPMFNSTPFDDSMAAEFNDFTNLYADSPGLGKPTRDPVPSSHQSAYAQTAAHLPHSASTEGSSQDSGSDSSSRRKRKVTSESPISDAVTEQPRVKQEEDSMMDIGGSHGIQQFDQNFTQPMHELSLKHEDTMGSHFGFNSSTSSPVQARDFNSALSLNAQTINPGMFQLGSRDDSPGATNKMLFQSASPTAIFSTPSSDSNETYNGNSTWNNNMGQNPTWPGNYSNHFGPSDGFGLTPSPVVNGATPVLPVRSGGGPVIGRSPLHIAPISTKSRVETQINVVMTLEKPGPGVEYLHLPLHTIAKSKLLAKDQYDKSKALELHAMLVCTSAMNNPRLKEKALARAAAQDNLEIQRRAERLREVSDEDKNSMADVEEGDKPSNGGEVRICSNCIQRERKRAGRKKLKKEEEQQHWERFETERVVVFNSNEFLPFKSCEQSHSGSRDGATATDDSTYVPPEGALQVSAAMRIACYCRHQSEKEGFRVIFTLKDHQGAVVAQQMSDSILITDDHKTHPQSFSTSVPGEIFYQNPGFSAGGLPTSYSMVDLSSQVHPFPSSRSTGNLQAMGYGSQQYNAHSHIHQMPGGGYGSQNTSATMTPTTLSRPASPSSAGQAGPNKKRKSSSFHRRVPSGLTMTPRVDTNQNPNAGVGSSMTMTGQQSFSPSSAGGYSAPADQSYMTLPNHAGQAHFYGSGPPTPANEAAQFFAQAQLDMTRSQNASAYFSHPSSAVPSRATSPVLQSSRPNMAAYARQPVQTTTNSLQGRQPIYGGQNLTGTAGNDQENSSPPTITKITPSEGPVSGGTEVSIYGYNFTNGTQVMFGEQLATTVFYGPQALLATSPPSRPGGVNVTLVPPAGSSVQYASPASSRQIFTYTDTNPRMMEMALRFLSQQQTGSQMPWNQFANQVATKFMQSGMNTNSARGPGYDGGNMMVMPNQDAEEMILHIFDLIDVSESPQPPCYDMTTENGEAMLSLACASGMHRVAAALLARGANPDIRDLGGYTPLMHAALHARTKTFQLLMARGADPTVRSLKGYSALDLVPAEIREEFVHLLQSTPRSRHEGARLPLSRSFASLASSRASWDISSASLYDSELETTSQIEMTSAPASPPPSPRSPAAPNVHVTKHQSTPDKLCPSAMLAWRDGLAAQIQHFQQSVQHHLPHFQLPVLPPLPALPDYQDSAVVRRISSLVPGRSSTPSTMRPSHAANASPPPAYDELFPETGSGNAVSMKNVLLTAVANEKCATASDIKITGTRQEGDGGLTSSLLVGATLILSALAMHRLSSLLLFLLAPLALALLSDGLQRKLVSYATSGSASAA